MPSILKISIVLLNTGAGRFLDQAINSVTMQAGPNLDLILVDTSATPSAQASLERYRPWASHILSVPGASQAEALNRGFAHATGETMGWLDSQAVLLPGALCRIGRLFAARETLSWITGRQIRLDAAGEIVLNAPPRALSQLRFLAGDCQWIHPETTFWRRSLWTRAGGRMDSGLQLAFDTDLWFRFFQHSPLHPVDTDIAAFRRDPDQRAGTRQAYRAELESLIARHRAHAEPLRRKTHPAIFDGAPLPRLRNQVAGLPGIAAEDPQILSVPQIDSGLRNPRHKVVPPPDAPTSASDLTGFWGRHTGERCIIMGNGPSLNQMDLRAFAGETVFAANSVYLLFDRLPWRPRYYSCVDTRVLPDIAPDILEMHRTNPEMQLFFPSELIIWDGSGARLNTRHIIPPAPSRWFFWEESYSFSTLPRSAFSLDCGDHLCRPHTVIITLMQLAAYMGFKELYLIGCDTSYTLPKTVRQEGPEVGDGTSEKLLLTSTEDDDPNHFDSRYFGRGRKWHAPKVQDMIFHYRHAAQVLADTDIRVFNATVGGNLEVFPRVDYRDILRGAQLRA